MGDITVVTREVEGQALMSSCWRPATGLEGMAYRCDMGSSDWISGEGSSPWSDTRTESPDEWSWHQAYWSLRSI